MNMCPELADGGEIILHRNVSFLGQKSPIGM